MSPCMLCAYGCCYYALDFGKCTFLCANRSEVLCCVQEACLAVDQPSLGFGVTTNEDNNEYCKISLPFCGTGLKTPATLCRGGGRCLCFKSATAFPFDDQYVGKFVCAPCCCIQCAPDCDCCGPSGTESPGLDKALNDYSSAATTEKVERD
jgi:hypothetical protein